LKQITPYTNDEGKKVQVERMFDNIAPTYDLLNHLLSFGIDRRWRKKLVNHLKAHTPASVLDLATGTGDLAVAIALAIPDARVEGLDLSEKMLKEARLKIRKKKLTSRIGLLQGEAENLPYQDNTFDAVTVAFGVRNFEDLDRGLNEINRVLRKSGVVYILEFSRPQSFPFRYVFGIYFRWILPMIGRWSSKDKNAYRYLYESANAFPDGDRFCQRLEKTGFSKPGYKKLTLGVCTLYTALKY
jgi:demethylmenaquinone methyltransferase/2-methoxy-6-polyprenyl-1,4-benzoquinol methylase